jgi:broad specificity phosphatase PhoE
VSGLVPPDLTATLVFVRHGETTWIASGRFQGQRDPRLSKLGRQQATAVAARLADPLMPPPLPIPPGRPVAVWHSPLQRAKATAVPIAAATGAPAVAIAGLVELSQGDWEGRTRRAIARRGGGVEAWLADPVRNAAPGGETVASAVPRIQRALGEVLSELGSHAGPPPPWGIVVAHGGAMRVALLLLLELRLRDFWEFPFDPAAISIVEIAAGRAQLRAHNLAGHLASLAEPQPIDRAGAL